MTTHIACRDPGCDACNAPRARLSVALLDGDGNVIDELRADDDDTADRFAERVASTVRAAWRRAERREREGL